MRKAINTGVHRFQDTFIGLKDEGLRWHLSPWAPEAGIVMLQRRDNNKPSIFGWKLVSLSQSLIDRLT